LQRIRPGITVHPKMAEATAEQPASPPPSTAAASSAEHPQSSRQ
jgi:hypothetical protein